MSLRSVYLNRQSTASSRCTPSTFAATSSVSNADDGVIEYRHRDFSANEGFGN
jgi:hypothetical protein